MSNNAPNAGREPRRRVGNDPSSPSRADLRSHEVARAVQAGWTERAVADLTRASRS